MPVFDRNVIIRGRIFLAGTEIPDDEAAHVQHPALLAQMAGEAPAPPAGGPELGDPGVRKVDEVIAWVGDDPDRAASALQWEHDTRGDESRVSLLHALNDIIAGG
jgi:hypothetical protein